MKAFVLALPMALCACTSQQYAQFNHRVNDSISSALGTQTEPPPPREWKSETAIADEPAPTPSAQERDYVWDNNTKNADYASRMAGSLYGGSNGNSAPTGKVVITPKPQPKQTTARGIDRVDGAIVCPSMDEAMWLFRQIEMARATRASMSAEQIQHAALVDGWDRGAEPRPSDYRCQFVPAGTAMNIRLEGDIPVVWGKMSDGRPFAGVTLLGMVDY